MWTEKVELIKVKRRYISYTFQLIDWGLVLATNRTNSKIVWVSIR